ncbi:excinuclease ABC subunit UvrC [Hoeflea sp. CAU 1731]
MTPKEDTTAECDRNEQISQEPATNAASWEGAGAFPSNLTGPERIQEFVKILPNAPGVYRMLNRDGDILYVGKARSLKKRVSNYAQGRGHTNRISSMVRDTANMEFITTRTETEALLLEANLIKRFKPRYNVLLRDDKSFPYILLTGDHEAAGIYKHRGARSRQGSYFGPFASAQAVDRTINALQRAFLIRTCTNAMYETRTRPCLLYQIKRCSAPCTGEIDLASYGKLVDEATDFLSGKSQKVKGTLSEAMQKASEELDFERAAVYRDRLAALSHVQSHQGINPQTVQEADVFAIHQDGGLNCIQVFFFRTGQNWGNRAYFPKADPALSQEEVLGAFLAQFYDDKPCPKQILVSHSIPESELLIEALSMRAGRKVSISVPHRGEKRDLVQQVAANAREAHGRRLSETSTQGNLLKAMASTFGLARPPRRIEVYDNSHIMGANAVGGMIVAGAEGFAKNQYRKFNIKSEEITPGDDFGMMREVLHRRIARLIKEHERPQTKETDEDSHDVAEMPAWPDLLLIDGGQGQLSAVQGILDELGVGDEITAVGVAKGVDREAGRERFFMKGRQAFSLPPRDPVLYFIQRMRDEAHRYAIGAHRARRSKELTRNPLDEIAGIGPARKRSLLHHFGTAKAVSRAGVEDLVAVEGISQATAQMIYDHFHEDRRN